jgi:hypothetical protein
VIARNGCSERETKFLPSSSSSAIGGLLTDYLLLSRGVARREPHPTIAVTPTRRLADTPPLMREARLKSPPTDHQLSATG